MRKVGYLARGPSSLTREAAGISFAKCTPNPNFFSLSYLDQQHYRGSENESEPKRSEKSAREFLEPNELSKSRLFCMCDQEKVGSSFHGIIRCIRPHDFARKTHPGRLRRCE